MTYPSRDDRVGKTSLSQKDIDELMENHQGYIASRWPSSVERDSLTRRMGRQNALAFFWVTVIGLIVIGIVFMTFDSETCVSSMMVEVGQEPVVNPVSCV